MSLATFFGWKINDANGDELPDIFPLGVTKDNFVKIDIINIYSKILTDVMERTQGLSTDQMTLLWDNCLKSSANDGLITMLAKAMADKQELFLVLDSGVLRVATSTETEQIKKDYAEKAESSVGIYISFKNYTRSDMVKLYSALEYCTVGALNKSMNLSRAIQFKVDKLRESVGAIDSTEVKAQAKSVATSLGNGKDVMIDAKDIIETSKPDLTSVKESVMFLNQKRSFYLGMPESYINGEQTGGLGTTGENDTKAIERGLKNYYFSIMKPVLEAVFPGVKLSYKSQDFRQLTQGLEALKTFTLVDDTLISAENKKTVVDRLFDFEETSDARKNEPRDAKKTGKPNNE